MCVPSSFPFCHPAKPHQVAVGTKSGEILIYNIASSSLQTLQAHSSTIWSLQLQVDEQTLVSGSADNNVKFWELKQTGVGDNVALGRFLLQRAS